MNNYTKEELINLLGSVGENVSVHRTVIFFNSKKIHIGNNVRIDCFCLLSAGHEGIYISNYVHIGSSSHLFGSGAKIFVGDFANISSRVSLFTSNDDYSGQTMTNPTISSKYKNVEVGFVSIDRHAIIGCGSIILPNVEIKTGGAVGALSLVKRTVKEFEIVGGVPAKTIGIRSQNVLQLAETFETSEFSSQITNQ